jgi:hypothetical protein
MDASGVNLEDTASLGIAVALSLAVGFGLFRLLVLLWKWTFRGAQDRKSRLIEAAAKEPVVSLGDPKLTATHILAIKSNLDAVSRQLADLEVRLRLPS